MRGYQIEKFQSPHFLNFSFGETKMGIRRKGTPSEIKEAIKVMLSEDPDCSYDCDIVSQNLSIEFSDVVIPEVKLYVKELLTEDFFVGDLDEFSWNPKEESAIDFLKNEVKSLKAQLKSHSKPQYIGVQLIRGKKVVRTSKEVMHEKMPRIIQLSQARKNIMLFGPAGCGKTFIAEQLARCLDLPFAGISFTAGLNERELVGQTSITTQSKGALVYIPSQFVEIYENGGVFLLDELDAADPNMLLIINMALANGKLPVSKRTDNPVAIQHKDFICVATANTAGTNADRLYAGRSKLDASTLDRFQVGKIAIDYDRNIEISLTKNKELLDWVWGVRTAIKEHRLERVMSTRFIRDSDDMIEGQGWSLEEVQESYFCGWREEEINKVKQHIQENTKNVQFKNAFGGK